jgi:hypothetical protein
VVNFEHTRFPAIRYSLTRMVTQGITMFTPAKCLTVAQQKLAEAERDPKRRRRLRKAAEAWVILANQLIGAEEVIERASARTGPPIRRLVV